MTSRSYSLKSKQYKRHPYLYSADRYPSIPRLSTPLFASVFSSAMTTAPTGDERPRQHTDGVLDPQPVIDDTLRKRELSVSFLSVPSSPYCGINKPHQSDMNLQKFIVEKPHHKARSKSTVAISDEISDIPKQNSVWQEEDLHVDDPPQKVSRTHIDQKVFRSTSSMTPPLSMPRISPSCTPPRSGQEISVSAPCPAAVHE